MSIPTHKQALAEGLHREPRDYPLYVRARSGKVHDFNCWTFEGMGTCDCPLVLAIYPASARWTPKKGKTRC